MWCHLAKLFPASDHKERVSKYMEHVCEVNYMGIKFPVTLKQIPKIEEQNNISFNSFTYEDESPTKIFPVYVSKKRCDAHCDLLMISGETNWHYCLIQCFNSLMGSTISKKGHVLFFSRYCLQHFTTHDILSRHLENCITINGLQAIEKPKEDTKLKFINHNRRLPAPFAIYADFEALSEKIDVVLNSGDVSSTTQHENHRIC